MTIFFWVLFGVLLVLVVGQAWIVWVLVRRVEELKSVNTYYMRLSNDGLNDRVRMAIDHGREKVELHWKLRQQRQTIKNLTRSVEMLVAEESRH